MVCKYCGRDQGNITTKFCRFCGNLILTDDVMNNASQPVYTPNIPAPVINENIAVSARESSIADPKMAEYEQISKDLKFYKQLETDGLISEEDYNAVKKKILGI